MVAQFDERWKTPTCGSASRTWSSVVEWVLKAPMGKARSWASGRKDEDLIIVAHDPPDRSSSKWKIGGSSLTGRRHFPHRHRRPQPGHPGRGGHAPRASAGARRRPAAGGGRHLRRPHRPDPDPASSRNTGCAREFELERAFQTPKSAKAATPTGRDIVAGQHRAPAGHQNRRAVDAEGIGLRTGSMNRDRIARRGRAG